MPVPLPVQQELDQQQQIKINKEKQIYSPPTLTVIGAMKEIVKGGNIGISEHICGCGIGS